ncbi:HPr kinase/phosphorylase [Methylobacterium radiotolerans]|uniref:HPr kinase/phosphorylase n=1 Tax=Methylobacterium radiotolerans TaxID=31998 RepID=UPI0003F539D6|nr:MULTISPECIES: aldolase [Methylobacterium]KTS10328.1 aldolase [Methylobacterium radiotolerans]KTS49333.1 aldolase [Methylobacterium radiotolerans]KZC02135.1 HPr kinase/phosphorylase [Methylobacterium radiotolerans]MBY0252734.1 aldolase [Methylobacterium organophilum]MDE3746608.1 aldolase [Methylobacterium radiotolerans]
MVTLHGACIALRGAGILIRGPSGAGKSSLALLLAAAPDGAFVADDRVVCAIRDGRVTAAAHPALVGRVEVRGQGILSAVDLGLDVRPEAVLHLAVDLVETASRLPDPPADADILGAAVPRLVLDRGVRAAGLAPLLVRAALRKLRP